MLKRIALGLSFAAVLGFAVAPLLFSDEKAPAKCPGKIEKAFYCDACKAFLHGDYCGKCKAPDWCDACKKASFCEKCKKNVGLVDCCVATGWECPGCHAWSLEKGHCDKCNKDLVQGKDRALLVWKCPGCGAEMKEGATCEKCKKAAEKTCSKAGTCPHCSPAK